MQATGMTLLTTSWGIGLVVGPALGGILCQVGGFESLGKWHSEYPRAHERECFVAG